MQYFRNWARITLCAMALSLLSPSRCAEPAPADLGRKALRLLAAALSDGDADTRAAAAAAWGQIGNQAALPLLRKALRDRNARVRVEAGYALHLLGVDDGLPELMATVRRGSVPIDGLSATEEMRWLARSKSRILAIQRLSEIGGADVVSLFEKTLKDPSGPVRDATAIALARMGLDEFEQQFVEALKDADETVRATAVKALGEIGRAELFEPITQAAGDQSEIVREQAMLALAGYADFDTARLLEKGARDPDARVRARALAVLAQRQDREASPLLRAVLKDATNPEIALKCMAGLARRGDRVELALAEQKLSEKDADMRGLAVDVLRAADAPASTDLLMRVAESDRDGRLRVQAAAALIKRLSKRGAP